jgi:hypothetical protein
MTSLPTRAAVADGRGRDHVDHGKVGAQMTVVKWERSTPMAAPTRFTVACRNGSAAVFRTVQGWPTTNGLGASGTAQ